MKKIKLFSQLLIAMLAIAALGTSCESDTDDLNVVQTYTISFKSNGGTDVESIETVDGLASEPTAPEMEGYTFAGWYSDKTLETPFSFTSTVSGNTTLYAKWSINSYTVSFVTYEGDSSVADQSVEYCAYVTEPDPAPVREGYTLYDWYTEDDVRWKFATDKMGASDMILYAKWDIEGYKVRFYSSVDGDYTDLSSLLYDQYNVDYDTEITYKTTTPSNTTAYTFEGWYDNPEFEGGVYEFGIGTLATADLDLYAKWANASYKVTFELDGGAFATEGLNIEVDADNSMMIYYDSLAYEPTPDPTNGTLTFLGWYTSDAYTTKWDFETMAITAETTIYAHWLDVVGVAYFFNVVGADDFTTSYGSITTAEAYSSEPITAGDKVTELFPTDVKYDLVGWFTESKFDAGTEKYDFGSDVTGDMSLYAKWEIKSFAVTFDVGDGTFDGGTDPSGDVDYGEKVGEPGDPAHATLTFGGWYTEADGAGTEWDFGTMTITEATTLYAYWKDIVGTVSYYNVDAATDFATSYSGAVEVYKTAEILNGQSAEDLAAPASSSTDYMFDGWYTESDFDSGSAYAFPAITDYNTDLKLYAKYKLKEFTVTFNANGGAITDEATQTITIYGNATSIDATYDGYLFQGWYYNGSLFNFDTQITSDITLTAQWVATSDYSYVIYDEEDLIEFRTAVNDGTNTAATAILANDITITESNWTPIGDATNYFVGTFEGNNNTIYDLTISSTTNYQGLFGAVAGATIRNCTLSGASLTTSYTSTGNGTGASIGGFVGGAINSTSSTVTLSNLTVKNSAIKGGDSVGGIMGSANLYNQSYGVKIDISDCTIESDVTIEKTGNKYYLGGIIGYCSLGGTITNCHNKGAVTASNTNASNATTNAGIIGNAIGVTIVGCSNSGTISSKGNAFGGIVGSVGKNTSIIGCYNTGALVGTHASYGQNGAGIGGQVNATGIKIHSCYSTTMPTSSNTSATLGVLLGNFTSTTAEDSDFELQNCYYIGGTVAIGKDASIVSNTDDDGNVTYEPSLFADVAGVITNASNIAGLNLVVSTMNANSTFSGYDYKYQAGSDDSTSPYIVAR